MITGKRVLVIDDEDDTREVAKISLELVGGWEVLTACSGAEGLILAESRRPDAILLDVMMPGMDGPTTFEHLQGQEATRDIPVIMLTAKVQASDKISFRELGVTGVIAKPFDPMSLPQEISEVLGWI